MRFLSTFDLYIKNWPGSKLARRGNPTNEQKFYVDGSYYPNNALNEYALQPTCRLDLSCTANDRILDTDIHLTLTLVEGVYIFIRMYF